MSYTISGFSEAWQTLRGKIIPRERSRNRDFRIDINTYTPKNVTSDTILDEDDRTIITSGSNNITIRIKQTKTNKMAFREGTTIFIIHLGTGIVSINSYTDNNNILQIVNPYSFTKQIDIFVYFQNNWRPNISYNLEKDKNVSSLDISHRLRFRSLNYHPPSTILSNNEVLFYNKGGTLYLVSNDLNAQTEEDEGGLEIRGVSDLISPVQYYRMEDTAFDRYGKNIIDVIGNNQMTIVFDDDIYDPTFLPSSNGSALSLDTNSTLIWSNTTQFNTSFSVAFMSSVSGSLDGTGNLIHLGNLNYAVELAPTAANGMNLVSVFNGTRSTIGSGTIDLSSSAKDCILTYNGNGQCSFWVNETEIVNGNSSIIGGLSVGNNVCGFGNNISMTIDELRVYDRYLTQSDIVDSI